MPWNIRRDFHIDINAAYGSYLIVSATNSSLRQPPPDMVAGDGMPVRFHFWERGENGAVVAADPGPDTVFIFSGRPAGAPPGSDLLFLTNDFAEISAGVWEGRLELATSELYNHIAAAPAGPKIILGELEVRDGPDNTARNSFQFDLTARPQVYDADDAPASLPTAEAWLEARIGTIIRTTAEGPPVSSSCIVSGVSTAGVSGNYFYAGRDLSRPLFPLFSRDGTMNIFSSQFMLWNDGTHWILGSSSLSYTAKVASDDPSPIGLTGWVVETGSGGPTIVDGPAETTAATVGQLCRVGDVPSYVWYIAEHAGVGTTTWRQLSPPAIPGPYSEDAYATAAGVLAGGLYFTPAGAVRSVQNAM